MITVFYDGQCGLCRREIAYYQKIAPVGIFNWVDITKAPEALLILGISLAEGLKILHVQDKEGNIHKGVDAFITIWSGLPRWRVAGYLAKLPFLHGALQIFYRAFAAWRFKRLNYGQCDVK